MNAASKQNESLRSELTATLASCRLAFVGLAVFSGVINALMLTGAIFMLEVYDRVLPSRSVPTLIGLSVLAGMLFIFLGILDWIRGRILVRIGAHLNRSLSARIFDVIGVLPLKTRPVGDGLQPLRDLDNVRSFLSGGGPNALFDLPWLPFYLALCFAFHFWIGMTALLGAAVLACLTLLTEVLTRGPIGSATRVGAARLKLAEIRRRNAEVLAAMGMGEAVARKWQMLDERYMCQQQSASDVAGGLGAAVRALRMMLQSGVLAVGAYLVIRQEATSGAIIASSIIAARALAPVDLAVANWKGFVTARQSWHRLANLLRQVPARDSAAFLPAPRECLSAEAASVVPPGGQRPTAQDISFSLSAGQALGVIGPSASGKSSLARMLVGAWSPARGSVRLDGASLDQWSPTHLGPHVGYLPQDVELIEGSIAENIARFDPAADPEKLIAAARAADVHDMIVALPDGYDTPIGEQGALLSAGQQQRIALARALYRDPFLVVLDEPNSNLDAEGEEALTRAILDVKARNGVVVVIAHRPSALAGVDFVLVMAHGRQQAFGPKNEVLLKVLKRDTHVADALKAVEPNRVSL